MCEHLDKLKVEYTGVMVKWVTAHTSEQERKHMTE